MSVAFKYRLTQYGCFQIRQCGLTRLSRFNNRVFRSQIGYNASGASVPACQIIYRARYKSDYRIFRNQVGCDANRAGVPACQLFDN